MTTSRLHCHKQLTHNDTDMYCEKVHLHHGVARGHVSNSEKKKQEKLGTDDYQILLV